MKTATTKRKKITRHKTFFFLFMLAASLIIAACESEISIISQPATVTAGDTAKIVLKLQWKVVNGSQNQRQVLGICVPKAWNASQNAVITYNSDLGSGRMVVIPAGTLEPSSKLPYPEAFLAKFNIGPNYINDMEWVVYWSDNKFAVNNGDSPGGIFNVNIKTSGDNLSVRPGYVMCEENDGISDDRTGYYSSIFGSCMLVSSPNGGDIQDFCNPQIGTSEPGTATENDLLTFTYNGGLDSTALKNEQDVYLCSTAYLTDGSVINKCQQTEETKLTKSDVQQWRIDFWPARFYNLTAQQKISRIEYFFTNANGSLKTGYGNSPVPFKYTFKCQ